MASSSIRTLIIEDDDSSRNNIINTLTKISEAAGIEFKSSVQGWGKLATLEEGLQAILYSWNDLDLVILDSQLPSVLKLALVKDAGVQILDKIYEYAAKENLSIPFKFIVYTAYLDVGTKYMQLSPLIREVISGYAVKEEEALEKELNIFIEGFLETDNISIEDQLGKIGDYIINKRQYEHFDEQQLIFEPDDILYVKGDGSSHKYYITHRKAQQLHEFLYEESVAEKLRNDQNYLSMSQEISLQKKIRKGSEKNVELDQLVSKLKLYVEAFKNSLNIPNNKEVRYIRFTGSIKSFKKIIQDKGLAQFRQVHTSYIINVKYLYSFGTNERNRKYLLFDPTIPPGDKSGYYMIPDNSLRNK